MATVCIGLNLLKGHMFLKNSLISRLEIFYVWTQLDFHVYLCNHYDAP